MKSKQTILLTNCADRRSLIYVRGEAVLSYFYNWPTLLSTFSQLGMHRKKKRQ